MNRSFLMVLFLSGCCPTFNFGNKTATPTPAPAPAQTGHVSGTVFGTDGKPFAVKGAKIKVGVGGVSAAGANVSFSPAVENGHYDLEPPKGLYQVHARLELDWNGKHFVMDLDPVQDNTVQRDSSKGFVQDFTWRIQGKRRGDADPNNHTHWYGATASMVYGIYREDMKKGVPQPPPGTKAVFTFTPAGPLVDGSEGKPVTFERPFDKVLTGLTTNNCCDLPLGDYKITGAIHFPDGKTQPAAFETAYAKYADSYDYVLTPDSITGSFCRIVGFTRPPE